MNTTITQTELDAVAKQLDFDAREDARSEVASDTCTAETFVVAYMHALARRLSQQSAEECAEGEVWEPARILDGDRDELEAQAEVLKIELAPSDWTALRASYGVTR